MIKWLDSKLTKVSLFCHSVTHPLLLLKLLQLVAGGVAVGDGHLGGGAVEVGLD